VPKGPRKLVVSWVRGKEYRGHGGLPRRTTALVRALGGSPAAPFLVSFQGAVGSTAPQWATLALPEV
jgi:hypothetical protein